MAFAHVVAAVFYIDHMAPLVLFAECLGASRLMDACSWFIDLWKGKHETGQWLEIEAAEAMSNRSDFSAMNASGIMLSSMANKQNESHGDLASEDNGKAAIDASAGDKTVTDANEERAIVLYKPDSHPPEANGSIAQEGNSKVQLLKVLETQRSVLQKEQGMAFARAVAAGFDIDHMAPLVSFAECFGASRLMDACSRFVDLWKVKHETGQWLEIEAAEAMSNRSDFSAMNASGIMLSSMANKQNESHGDLASEDNGKAAIDASAGDKTVTDANEERAIVLYKPDLHPPEANGSIAQEGNSKYILVLRVQLLKVLERRRSVLQKEQGMAFARAVAAGFDIDHMAPLVSFAVVGRDSTEGQDGRITEFHKASGNVARMLRASNDEGLISRGEGHYGDGIGSTDDQMDIQFTETNGRKVLYRNNANDDFMIVGRENQSHFLSSSDPLVVNGFTRATNNLDGSSPQDMIDESFIVPFQSMSLDHVGTNVRTAIDMDSELPSTMQRSEYSSNRTGNQINYEPDDLSFMPECGTEKMTTGYDPALDYEMQAHVEDAASLDNRNKEVVVDVKQGSKKSGKDRKSKFAPDALDKKTVGPIRKGKTSKMSPLDDARARAEKLRAFKADLQKMKKEKEEEDRKRLEALKMEREKRIAAKGSSTAQSASSQKTRKQLPTKLALSSVKGTKFSDSEPGSSSPLQRSKIRTASTGSSEPHKASKSNKSSNGSHLPGNRLTRSVSSLPEPRKENSDVTPDPKVPMARIRRLSEPKTVSSPYVAPVKSRGAELVSKLSNEPERKDISDIINLDKSKAATLPELKIRTSKVPLDVGRNTSAPKEMTQKVNVKKSSLTSGSTELNRNNDQHTHQSDVDDNPVIEKTVVMLECEKPSFPIVHPSQENMGVQKEHYDNHDNLEKTEVISEYAAIRAPASPMEGVDIEPIQSQLQEQPRVYEVTTSYAENEPPNSSSMYSAEKPYQAPLARLSSLEDPCTDNSVYGKAPSTNLETATMGVETAKAQVSGFENLKLEKIPEVLEKPQVKVSPKGFRRLLKFGKKSHSSTAGEHSVESDNVSVSGSEVDGNATNAASSGEVHTLKNLISQDETPTSGATSQKSSRHFSILSPFRSKTSEKKSTT